MCRYEKAAQDERLNVQCNDETMIPISAKQSLLSQTPAKSDQTSSPPNSHSRDVGDVATEAEVGGFAHLHFPEIPDHSTSWVPYHAGCQCEACMHLLWECVTAPGSQ
jgi:hypothetical protein